MHKFIIQINSITCCLFLMNSSLTIWGSSTSLVLHHVMLIRVMEFEVRNFFKGSYLHALQIRKFSKRKFSRIVDELEVLCWNILCLNLLCWNSSRWWYIRNFLHYIYIKINHAESICDPASLAISSLFLRKTSSKPGLSSAELHLEKRTTWKREICIVVSVVC